jgi:hypothetical protein
MDDGSWLVLVQRWWTRSRERGDLPPVTAFAMQSNALRRINQVTFEFDSHAKIALFLSRLYEMVAMVFW